MIPFSHNKTGKTYLLLAHGTDATNSRNGTSVVVYCPDDDGNTIFVRDADEFHAKFSPIAGDSAE